MRTMPHVLHSCVTASHLVFASSAAESGDSRALTPGRGEETIQLAQVVLAEMDGALRGVLARFAGGLATLGPLAFGGEAAVFGHAESPPSSMRQ